MSRMKKSKVSASWIHPRLERINHSPVNDDALITEVENAPICPREEEEGVHLLLLDWLPGEEPSELSSPNLSTLSLSPLSSLSPSLS